MSEPEAEPAEEQAEALPPRRRRRRGLGVLGLLLVLGLAIVWMARERIANSIIAGQVEELGLPATYEIESIGTGKQVLKNIVIGDPQRPDLVVPRAELEFSPRLGVPVLASVKLENARIYGTYRNGKLSLGALDPIIFAKRDGPRGLPDLDLELVDARARIESDFGTIGAKAEGRGNLRNGFRGKLAAVLPQLDVAGCKGSQATLYGEVTSSSALAQFSGPLRLKSLACPGRQIALRDAAVQLDAQLGEKFDSLKGNYALRSGPLGWQSAKAARIEAQGAFSLAEGKLVADYDLAAGDADLGAAAASELALEGTVRSRDGLLGFDGEGRLSAKGLRSGRDLAGGLASLEKSGEGTLVAPLARQLRTALAREERGSSLHADYVLRQTGGITQLTIPSAELLGGSGARLVGISRLAVSLGMKGGPRFSGQFVTGGAGLPRMEGTARRTGSGGMEARLKLAEYRAGSSAVALPDLRLVQLPGGEIGFAGRAQVSGALPGGEVRDLVLPVDGNWSERRGLAAWRGCTPVSFARLKVGNLALLNRGLTLCPGSDGAILRSDGRGTRLAAGAASLDLAGTLGTTPIRMKSRAIGFAWPGRFVARGIDVSMGKLATPSTLKVDHFAGNLGQVVTGHFTGAELKLFPVPLDLSQGEGDLRFADGDLAVTGTSFKLADREEQPRFEPLTARDATLQLHSTTFTAQAMLREPRSDREIVLASIEHDLDTAAGHADLKVPGMVFDERMQPTTLTYLAQGVIALAKGTVTGDGRIDWDARGVTSTGQFTTESLDFAAAFGPVKGTRGTVRFTDLLGLVTAPDQRLKLASINPGIEVFDGEVSFQLEPGRTLVVNGAHWPFIDGTLELMPTTMVLGASEVRRFTLKVDGANAAKFVSQLELGNISATGLFDGTLPLVFDQEGGRIENGLLVSRLPGGNLSYVGELTYKDLSAMGNFAFQTLRSLDFRRMEIGLNGQIDGDIVTTMRIEGVRQGKGSKRNFITRQLAGLPVQFNINIKAPFYQLVTSFKSMYDPAYVRDPRELGLLDEQGRRREAGVENPAPADQPAAPGPAGPQPGPKPAPSLPPPATPTPAQPPQQKNDDIQHSDSRGGP